jgi:cation/acetate symporter
VVGELLSAMLAGGAFAALLSTASGLTICVAGVVDQDLVRGRLRRFTGDDARAVNGFRISAVAAVAVPFALSLAARDLGLAETVGLAFAIAASTFCPLLVLGIWWRRLSTTGAVAGLIAGGLLAMSAVLATVVGDVTGGWAGALLAQPAAWTVPIAFLVTVLVSMATPSRIPKGTARTMVRLHTPENLDLDRAPR